MKKVKAKKLNDGDIIYLDLQFLSYDNEHLIGVDADLSGSDVIFIVDDVCDVRNGFLHVNGGHNLYIGKNDKVIIIGHFSKLLKDIENKIN